MGWLGACRLVFGLNVSHTPLICETGVVTRTLDMRQHLGLLQLVRFLVGTRSRYLFLSVLSIFPTTNVIKCLAFLVDVRHLLREGVVLRPLRLTPVKSISSISPDDHAFPRHPRVNCFPVKFLSPCPLRGISQPAARYRHFMYASTLTQSTELRATVEDIHQAYAKQRLCFFSS